MPLKNGSFPNLILHVLKQNRGRDMCKHLAIWSPVFVITLTRIHHRIRLHSHIYSDGLTLILAWLIHFMPSKVWDELTFPFHCNLWSLGMDSNFIPHITMDVILETVKVSRVAYFLYLRHYGKPFETGPSQTPHCAMFMFRAWKALFCCQYSRDLLVLKRWSERKLTQTWLVYRCL